MNLNDSIEQDDDNWYAESFTRYNELVMLEMEWTVRRLRVSDKATVTMLVEKGPEDARHQFLAQYSLPTKIIRNNDSQVKKGDISLISALSLGEESVLNIECVPNENSTVASMKGQRSLNRFCHDLDESGQFKTSPNSLELPTLEPKFCLVDSQLFLTAKRTSDCCYLANFVTKSCEALNFGEWANSSNDSPLLPESLSHDLVAVCRQSNGRTVCLDLRSHKITHDITERDKTNSIWTFTSSFRGNRDTTSKLLCFRATDGSIEVFDLRASSKRPLLESHDESLLLHKPAGAADDDRHPLITVRFSPDARSISTTDDASSIHVYSIEESNLRRVFTHEGHSRMENCSRRTRITDHEWYDPGCVISSADNDSLNIWQFNAD